MNGTVPRAGTLTVVRPIATNLAMSRSTAMAAEISVPLRAGPGCPAGPGWAKKEPPRDPGSSTRTGDAWSRCRWSMTRSNDQFSPSANVAAATPTTRAPRVIVARTGWATPAETPSRIGSGSGNRSPSRRSRPPSGRPDGADPRDIAATALMRPARRAGPIAASTAVTTATTRTAAMTVADNVKALGSPNDIAVFATIGALAMVPTMTPPSDPMTTGTTIWATRIAVT